MATVDTAQTTAAARGTSPLPRRILQALGGLASLGLLAVIVWRWGGGGGGLSVGGKFVLMAIAIAIFALVFGAVLFFAGLMQGRHAERIQAASFVGPALLLLAVGLIYPALATVVKSLQGPQSKTWVGLSNFKAIFTQSGLLIVLRNTAIWVLLVPFLATVVGLLYAILVDKAKLESFAKGLIFLPMAISFVGAGIIWKFVYAYNGSTSHGKPVQQIGILNEIIVNLGGKPYNFLLNSPWNTLFLIVVMIWIQAGFATVILSAAIKAIPDDIVEAAKLDGVNAWTMFRFVTLPSIRPTVVVVLTAIGIATLKVFDIVRTMTGGNYNTSVIANEFYQQSFPLFDFGMGSALAVILFILVIPVVIYNIRQMRKA